MLEVKMASEEGIGGAHLTIVREILNALNVRKERKASSVAGRLVFWDDGMLKELRAIASGDADLDTINDLREKFESSENRVNDADSDECGQRFRLKADIGSDRLRTAFR